MSNVIFSGEFDRHAAGLWQAAETLSRVSSFSAAPGQASASKIARATWLQLFDNPTQAMTPA
jgi:hypothetical protein